MGKTQCLGMERKPVKRACTVAIAFVAHYWASEVFGMDANLIFSAGIERELSQCASFTAATHLISRQGKFSFAIF